MELNLGVWSAFSSKIVMVYAAGWSLRLTHELILANFIWLLKFFNKAIASKFWKQYFLELAFLMSSFVALLVAFKILY